MPRLLLLCLLALLLVPSPALPGPRSKKFEEDVNAAIDRGVAWLRTRQRENGSWDVNRMKGFYVQAVERLGPTALGLYTLRSCGAEFEDPDVARGFVYLRKQYDHLKTVPQGHDNYGIALTVLALAAQYKGEELRSPGEGYAPDPIRHRKIPDPDLEWMRELVRWLKAAQTKHGAFSYWSPAQGSTYDHSNTQFSMLALHAAEKTGVEVPDKVWRGALDHFLDTQEVKGPKVARFALPGVGDDGYGVGPPYEVVTGDRRDGDRARGWGYRKHDPVTGSMTAGAVSSLAICRGELRGTPLMPAALDRKVIKAIRDGIAWLGLNFTTTRNPGTTGAMAAMDIWHYYFLYGLERAGVLSGVTLFERKDWYLEGARFLLKAQREDGSWLGREAVAYAEARGIGPETPSAEYLDTCFALLFLKRATLPSRKGSVATETGAVRLDLEGAAKLSEKDFAELFGVVFKRFRSAPPEATGERATDFVKLGLRALPRLIFLLDAEKESVRRAAFEALRRTTRETMDYAPADPPAKRSQAAVNWERWWVSRGRNLTPDVEAGLFREK